MLIPGAVLLQQSRLVVSFVAETQVLAAEMKGNPALTQLRGESIGLDARD